MNSGRPAACPHVASLSVGVGARSGVPAAEVRGLVADALDAAGLPVCDVAALGTVDARATEPGVLAAARGLGVVLRTFPPEALAGVRVPNPSPAPLRAAGTSSVAEAAALLAAGEDARLVVPKRRSVPADGPARATAAVARAVPAACGCDPTCAVRTGGS